MGRGASGVSDADERRTVYVVGGNRVVRRYATSARPGESALLHKVAVRRKSEQTRVRSIITMVRIIIITTTTRAAVHAASVRSERRRRRDGTVASVLGSGT